MIKAIGTAARQELERFFDARVYLDLHVKVREDWRDDERMLDRLGLPRSPNAARNGVIAASARRSSRPNRMLQFERCSGLTDDRHGGAAQNRSRPRLGQATAAHRRDRQPAEPAAEAAPRRPRARSSASCPTTSAQAAFSLLVERNGRAGDGDASASSAPKRAPQLLAGRSAEEIAKLAAGDPVRRRGGADRLPARRAVGRSPRPDAAEASRARSRTCSSTTSRPPAAS